MPIIDLEEIRFGVIILHPTGVLYTNQVGGYICNHPNVEGAFVPLPVSDTALGHISEYFVGKKWGGHCYRGIDIETADYLDNILSSEIRLQFIKVDRERLSDCQEAWIYVDLVEPEGDPQMNQIAGFGSCKGILTWENSD